VHRVLVDKIRSYGDRASIAGQRQGTINGGNLDVHPEFLKLALFELFAENGIDYQLYSPVVDVLQENDSLKGVVIQEHTGEQTISAHQIVDATGDGDLCYFAGCEMASGRKTDGRHMPLTLVFALSNVDTEQFFDFINQENDLWAEKLTAARQKEQFWLADWYSFDRTTVPGAVSVNNGGTGDLNLEGTKSSHLTVGERVGLKLAHDFVNFVHQYQLPGLKDCHLIRTGDYVGVRDTRRLVGEYVLTEEDIMEGREFPDTVARKYGAMDAVGFDSGRLIKQGAAYPYRSLLPHRVDNLLAAGRCGSASFKGHSGGKSMGNMLALGQAAGTAAALAAKNKKSPRRLEVRKIQNELQKRDALQLT